MSSFDKILNPNNFSIDKIDTSEIDKVNEMLPKNGIIDINIAEYGLVLTLNAVNYCQDKIPSIDRHIGQLESEKNKAWSAAAIDKSAEAGHKTIKLKEWYAQADEGYIEACNQLAVAKACKKWFENKASYFLAWHYTFKTFLKRDYEVEKVGYTAPMEYNNDAEVANVSYKRAEQDNEFGGDYDDNDWE